MEISTIGLDLAKSVFQVHGVDARGKPVVQGICDALCPRRTSAAQVAFARCKA